MDIDAIHKALANPMRRQILAWLKDPGQYFPEQAHPHGRYTTLQEALAAFNATRAEVVRWVENCDGDLRCMMTDHMLIEGPVTCAEMLIMIAAHPARHSQQIGEIRASLAAF